MCVDQKEKRYDVKSLARQFSALAHESLLKYTQVDFFVPPKMYVP